MPCPIQRPRLAALAIAAFAHGLAVSTAWAAPDPSAKAPAQSVKPAPKPVARTAPIFVFESDEFWLNLHHFLYVLGSIEAKQSGASRVAIAGAPAEMQAGLSGLTEREQQIWRDAVTTYATGLSRKDIVFDEPLPAIGHALASLDETGALADARATVPPSDADALDARTRAALEGAAPIYRKAWWPAHRATNRAWQTAMAALVSQHGPTVLAFVTRAYALPWPKDGYRVHLSAYTSWAGAYSTRGDLLVVSTNTAAGRPDLLGLETVFHEAMHTWDDEIFAGLTQQASPQNLRVPRELTHAMIFYTAGEAVRHASPGHVPYAQAEGIWNRGLGRMRPVLDEAWKPYLDGKGTRDEALVALVARAAR